MEHNDTVCIKYNEPVLPNEQGNCSLCGAKLVVEVKEDSREDIPPVDWLTPVDYKALYEELSRQNGELVELLCPTCFDKYRLIA